MYMDIVAIAFGRGRTLNSVDGARCFVCRTACKPGRAALSRAGAVLCAGCKLDNTGRCSDDDASPPVGWPVPSVRYVLDVATMTTSLHMERNVAPVRTVAPSQGYTAPTVPVNAEILAIKAEIDAALVKAGKPAKYGTVKASPASAAGRALAGFRKPSDKRRDPLAAK